ncbi:MAG: MAPEG family protein [Lysobacteraceae bacterium]
MYAKALLLALLTQILLTIVLYLRLAIVKARAVKAGQTDETRRALHADAWPEPVQQVNNCIRNQFEVPVLFHVSGLMLWQLGQTGPAVAIVAWLFVLSRILHAREHCGRNHVPMRRRLFMFGCLMVLLLTLGAAFAVITG